MRGASLARPSTKTCGCGRGGRNAKLTGASADQIRERWRAGGITKKALALTFGVSQKLVRLVLTGSAWT